jgi:hypothetical protein
MASFAKLDNNDIVIQLVAVVNEVIKDSNGIEQEQLGIDFLRTLYNEPNANWKQTSYNTNAGVHSLGGAPFRKNYAGMGYQYDSQRDAFIPQKPYNSWLLNESTCRWEPPVIRPEITQEQKDNNQYYSWNEDIINWEVKTRQ